MATLKQRLRRKNSSGSYDTIYLQTDLSNVTGTLGVANGGTGTTSTAGIKTALSLPSDTNTEINTLKTSVSSGKALVAAAVTDKGVPTAADATFATIAGNVRSISSEAYAYIIIMYPAGATCTCTKGSKTYTAPNTSGNVVFGVDSTGDWVVTASDGSHTQSATVSITAQYQVTNKIIRFYPDWYVQVKNGTVGNKVNADNLTWLLVNKTSSAATLGLNIIYSKTKFGSNTTYAGSTLASVAASFEANQLSTETKQYLNDVTVNGVTAKVFVPSYEQMNGGFSHYNSTTNRLCQYSGSNDVYWTSSAGNSSRMWYVGSWGDLNYDSVGTPSTSLGFRPHIEVNLTL